MVVHFWSAECPWSQRADLHFNEYPNKFSNKVVILPVASNWNETIELITQSMQERNINIILLDKNNQLADAWEAQTTPHAFVFDQTGVLRYKGAVDDVTFRKHTPERFFVEEAVTALIAGTYPKVEETPPYGCTITRLA